MNKAFYQKILDKQQITGAVPSNKEIAEWALKVIRLLYPEQSNRLFTYVHQLEAEFKKLEQELCDILDAARGAHDEANEVLAKTFFESLPELYRMLNTRYTRSFHLRGRSPAAKSEFEVIRAYPRFLCDIILQPGQAIRFINWACRLSHVYLQNTRTPKQVSTYTPQP